MLIIFLCTYYSPNIIFYPYLFLDLSNSSLGMSTSTTPQDSLELDPDFHSGNTPKRILKIKFQEFGIKRFEKTVETADRLGVPNRVVAQLLHSFQEDTGAISKENRNKLVYPQKI